MSRIPQILPKDLVNALIKLGFFKLRQRGSHLRLKHPDDRKITIALHNKPLAKGTFLAILRQAQVSKKEIEELL